MRGKVIKIADFYGVSRITPAYAGKSCAMCSPQIVQKDHPRLCGEKLLLSFFLTSLLGSPPPMRGKAIFEPSILFITRITPAYAGKSPFHFQKGIYHKDHPRLCGEKHQLRENSHQNQGSPPPMRGKGSKRNIIFPVVRITPAYAGKSSTAPEIRL